MKGDTAIIVYMWGMTARNANAHTKTKFFSVMYAQLLVGGPCKKQACTMRLSQQLGRSQSCPFTRDARQKQAKTMRLAQRLDRSQSRSRCLYALDYVLLSHKEVQSERQITDIEISSAEVAWRCGAHVWRRFLESPGSVSVEAVSSKPKRTVYKKTTCATFSNF